jgi:hypothetical protein
MRSAGTTGGRSRTRQKLGGTYLQLSCVYGYDIETINNRLGLGPLHASEWVEVVWLAMGRFWLCSLEDWPANM